MGLGKQSKPPEPEFPHLQTEDDSIYLVQRLRENALEFQAECLDYNALSKWIDYRILAILRKILYKYKGAYLIKG